MSFEFSSVADDYFLNIGVQTTLSLPDARETVLHFCEAIQREFPDMTCFYQRETGEFILEGDREAGSYRWVELASNRLSAGFFNPNQAADAYRLHQWLLDRSVYFLGVSPLDIDALDVMIGFNLDYQGNRDAIVAQALFSGSPLGNLVAEAGGTSVECEPSIVMSLDEDCYLQARLALETRSNSFQVRTGQYDNEPISVYFTIRRYPRPGRVIDLKADFADQCDRCEDLVSRVVLPQVIYPISAAIASNGR